MCANFQTNLRGSRLFLLIWYGMTDTVHAVVLHIEIMEVEDFLP